jgi:hypothetical protein
VEDVAHCAWLDLVVWILYKGKIRTFVKAIHVELSYKGRNICMFEVLSDSVSKKHLHLL